MQIGDREITMPKGWIVQYTDGRIFCEEDMPWIKLPEKRKIRRVILKWEDRMWSLDDKENYMAPTTRSYMDCGAAGISHGIDSRTIGYYSVEENCKVMMRVDEVTGQMKYETKEF